MPIYRETVYLWMNACVNKRKRGKEEEGIKEQECVCVL